MAPELEPLLLAALELLRYYRSRWHETPESPDGGWSNYMMVYGVHRDARDEADRILRAAGEAGLLLPKDKMTEYNRAS